MKFAEPVVTLTFDDGWPKNVSNALPLLDKYGMKSTHFYMTDRLDSQEAVDGMLAFDRGGHEIGAHTVSHADLTTLSADELTRELDECQRILEGYLAKSVVHFASPYGSYNPQVVDAVDDYYLSHRTVDEGYNSLTNLNPFGLKVKNVYKTTTVVEISEWVAEAQARNAWLILLYHEIDDAASEYGTAPGIFESHLLAIQRSGVRVETYGVALNEMLAQVQNR